MCGIVSLIVTLLKLHASGAAVCNVNFVSRFCIKESRTGGHGDDVGRRSSHCFKVLQICFHWSVVIL